MSGPTRVMAALCLALICGALAEAMLTKPDPAGTKRPYATDAARQGARGGWGLRPEANPARVDAAVLRR